MIVESFPQTANGKLDRNALPDPPLQGDSSLPVYEEGDMHLADVAQEMKDHTKRTLADHICDTIQSFRGRRPKPSATFSSIGVDSLGAVMFLRYLSDSLGGLRLSPNSLYGPGITISSFAVEVHNRLVQEKPEVLTNLGLAAVPIIDTRAGHGAVLNAMEEGAGKGAVSGDQSECFDDRLMANQHMLVGLRGLFMLFVLWDHFRGPNYAVSSPLLSDTDMFVIISGFTTSLQLRPSRDEEGERAPWNWRQFLISRAVGIFPTLWLALIFNGYRWHKHDIWAASFYKQQFSDGDKAECVILYTIGMQGWARPLCHYLGPNDVLYASIIWNCFLMYAVLRVVLDWLQRSVRLAPVVSANSFPGAVELRSFLVNVWDYNLTPVQAVVVSICWFVVALILFIANKDTGTKVSVTSHQ